MRERERENELQSPRISGAPTAALQQTSIAIRIETYNLLLVLSNWVSCVDIYAGLGAHTVVDCRQNPMKGRMFHMLRSETEQLKDSRLTNQKA